MEVSPQIDQLQADGELLVSLAGAVDLMGDVPTCPGWTVADLLHHLGGVHRWATGFVRGTGRQPEDGDLEPFVGGWPPDEHLAEWLREGHADLVDALRTAPDDLDTWTFMAAPSPRAFWARRQAHETAIHRVDAETAAGDVTGFPIAFAVDGIDELLTGFAPRALELHHIDRPRLMAVDATDADATWLVSLNPNGISTRADVDEAPDASIGGTASSLYRYLWNRGGEIRVDGDEDVPRLWAETVRVTWS